MARGDAAHALPVRVLAAGLALALLCVLAAHGQMLPTPTEQGNVSAGQGRDAADRGAAMPRGGDGTGGGASATPGDGGCTEGSADAPDASPLFRDDASAIGGVSVQTRQGTVEQVACDLLASYRDSQDCVLASAGYLDLTGSVWGCVTYGGDWADVCVVCLRDGDSCQVRVAHLAGEELARQIPEDALGRKERGDVGHDR